MTIESELRAPLFAACIALAAAGSAQAQAQEVSAVSGDHWGKSTQQVKKACLVGIANLLRVGGVADGIAGDIRGSNQS